MTKMADIMHEVGRYWVLRVRTGFEVYEVRGVASYRIGRFGRGDTYLQRAISYANTRAQAAANI